MYSKLNFTLGMFDWFYSLAIKSFSGNTFFFIGSLSNKNSCEYFLQLGDLKTFTRVECNENILLNTTSH